MQKSSMLQNVKANGWQTRYSSVVITEGRCWGGSSRPGLLSSKRCLDSRQSPNAPLTCQAEEVTAET